MQSPRPPLWHSLPSRVTDAAAQAELAAAGVAAPAEDAAAVEAAAAAEKAAAEEARKAAHARVLTLIDDDDGAVAVGLGRIADWRCCSSSLFQGGDHIWSLCF
jgi:hypothetical protein